MTLIIVISGHHLFYVTWVKHLKFFSVYVANGRWLYSASLILLYRWQPLDKEQLLGVNSVAPFFLILQISTHTGCQPVTWKYSLLVSFRQVSTLSFIYLFSSALLDISLLYDGGHLYGGRKSVIEVCRRRPTGRLSEYNARKSVVFIKKKNRCISVSLCLQMTLYSVCRSYATQCIDILHLAEKIAIRHLRKATELQIKAECQKFWTEILPIVTYNRTTPLLNTQHKSR